MMVQEHHLLTAFVQRVRRGLTLRRLLQSGIVLLTVCLTVLLLGAGVQYIVPLVPLVAPLYSLLALGILVYLGLYVVWPALRPVSLRQALTSIEETYPDLHDDLTNAVQLNPEVLERSNPHGVALDLVQALHRRTAQQVQQYSVPEVVQRRRLLGLSWCAMVGLATVLVALVQPHVLGESLRLLVRPLSYLPSREIYIALTPEHLTIAAGMNVEVQAQASGRLPQHMQLLVQRQGQPDRRYPMEPRGHGAFRYTFLKPQTSLTFQAAADGFKSAVGTLEVVPAPAIGHMALQYVFPDYTGLPARTQEGGGDIQALPGTQVHLSMRANVPLTKGVLRFDSGYEVPLVINGQELHGEMLVMREGTYTVEVEDTHGLKNPQAPRYTIQVVPDLAPKVTIRQPQDGLEVDEMTTLQIQYEAEDDFGLQDATLVYTGAGGTAQRIPLHKGRFDNRQVQETFTWDMNQWPLPSGDSVQVYIEVYDNDTISGPKKGVSQTLTLKIHSREQEHQNLEQLQEEVAAAVLDLLADHLDLAEQLRTWQEQADTGKPTPSQEALQQAREQQRTAMEHAEQVTHQIEQALERVQHDPFSTYETYADLQALQRNMAHLQNTLMPQLQQSLQAMHPQSPSPAQLQQPKQQLEAAVQELERLSAFAEHIASGEKLNDMAQLSNKLLDQQNKLLAALDNLPKDFQGGELPPELQKMLDALQSLMQDLMQAMAQLPMTLPDEFLNRQLDSFPLSDMMRQLQEMKQKLEAGDVEGARQMAEQLLKNLSAMVAALQNMRQQARGGSLDAMSQQLMESSNKLADLVQRQEQIVDGTQDIDQDTLNQLNEAQKQAFDTVQRRFEQELNDLARLAGEMSRRARQHPELDTAFQDAYQQFLRQLHAVRKSLQDHELPQVAEDLAEAERQLAWMRQRAERLGQPDRTLQQQSARAQQHLQAMQQALDGLPQDRQAMLTPSQRGQLGELGQRQGGVRNDTQTLQQEVQRLLPLMPFLPAELGQQLQEALPFMGEAQGALEGQRSQQALPPEQEALERLRNAQNGMQQAMQNMAQRGQMMGMSMPMLRQAGRFPMPEFMPQPNVDEQQAGAAGASVRNFQLPDKQAYKVPRMFREDIMDALKQGYPERFKELIEQYYRNIVR
jgi:DNA repair ATPase RecN